MPFFRYGLIGGGPWVAVSVIRAGVPAVELNPEGRAELWRFFLQVVVGLGVLLVAGFWAGPCRFCFWSTWGEGADVLLVVGLW